MNFFISEFEPADWKVLSSSWCILVDVHTAYSILLTNCKGSTGRISAWSLGQWGLFKKVDRGPIFSQKGPKQSWSIVWSDFCITPPNKKNIVISCYWRFSKICCCWNLHCFHYSSFQVLNSSPEFGRMRSTTPSSTSWTLEIHTMHISSIKSKTLEIKMQKVGMQYSVTWKKKREKAKVRHTINSLWFWRLKWEFMCTKHVLSGLQKDTNWRVENNV